MALLMVHLLAARLWTEEHAEFSENPEYYLGAISPDAIHVRDHDDKSHKNEIHLNNWVSPHPQEVIDYWRKYHEPFDIGYGIHVLTDAQWVPRYRQRLPELIFENGRLDVERYYRETFVTDYELYRERDGAHLFDLVERGRAPEGHPLLTKYEFTEWQRMMVESYRGPCPKQGQPTLIDRAYVEAFIRDCQPLLNETYKEVFA